MTLREKAAVAINESTPAIGLLRDGDDLLIADAVIAAIEPDIRADERRKVFDELIAESAREAEERLGRDFAGNPIDMHGAWLRDRKQADDTVWLTDSETMVDRLASLRTSDDTTAFVASLTPHQRDYVRLCLDEERAEAAGE